jgi:hypothetical protein
VGSAQARSKTSACECADRNAAPSSGSKAVSAASQPASPETVKKHLEAIRKRLGMPAPVGRVLDGMAHGSVLPRKPTASLGSMNRALGAA